MKIASGKALINPNVFVYAADRAAGPKHRTAVALIEELSRDGRLIVTVQVLNELFWRGTRPHKAPGLGFEKAHGLIRDLAATAEVISLTPNLTLLALAAVAAHGLSCWDALIWAAAQAHAVPTIYTEDFQHGRDVEGVRFADPFQPAGA